jgi:hypothetical protein
MKIRSKPGLMGASDDGFEGAGLPSEVETSGVLPRFENRQVRAKLVKSAKCAAIMIFFRQNRDVV